MKIFRKCVLIINCCLSALLISTNSFAQNDLQLAQAEQSGIKRDLLYLLGYQMLATGIIYYSPEEFSGWSKEEKEGLGLHQWKENMQNIVRDNDRWGVNYVLHPYWGAAYYIRGRERGFSRSDSFWISAFFSVAFEFGFESFMEEPSIQDLIVTPVGGTVVGIYFEKVRSDITNKNEPLSIKDKLVLGLTDPLGTLNRKINTWFNINEKNPKSIVGLRLLRGRMEPREPFNQCSQLECGQNINGAAITFKYRW